MSARNGKPCVKCGANEWTKGGDCVPCTVVRHRQYYERNRERVKEKARQWREANPERKKANRKREYANNREKAKAAAREWNKLNSERKKQSSRAWYNANKDKANEASKRWARQNRDKINTRYRRWKQQKPEAVTAYTHQRRAKKIASGESFTATEWRALTEHYDNKCLCCGRTDVKLTADHVIPLSKGGPSSIDNIQPLCASCNSSKNTKTIDYRSDKGLPRWIQRKLFE